jgi:BlaI family transcriptional regulator, penicillinase repressor
MNEMITKRPSPRRSLLDLAPLELDCMNTLWPMGEGTVREIRERLAERRPRAYTTIMTIMDRLARKGVVERHKVGRAYSYRPNLSVEAARAQALGQVLENFFGGSREALLAQLGSNLQPALPDSTVGQGLRARAAAASASRGAARPDAVAAAPTVAMTAAAARPIETPAATEVESFSDEERIDDTLL